MNLFCGLLDQTVKKGGLLYSFGHIYIFFFTFETKFSH